MSSHYFTNDQSLDDKSYNFTYYYKEHMLSLTSGAGVFSKGRVDFGTHTLLETFKPSTEVSRILDVGCGIGIIGLSLALDHEGAKVDMIDINKRAVKLAELNRLANNVTNAQVFYSDLFSNVNKNYNIIICNPPIRAGKDVVHKIVDESFLHLEVDGEFWVVIQKKQGAPSLVTKISSVFNNHTIVTKKKGYWIIQAKKL